MARRATLINKYRNSTQGAVLTLDAGNALLGQPLANSTESAVVIESMNALAYDAMGLGGQDLDHGIEQVLKHAKETKFPILSCNFLDKQSGQPALTPYTILTRDGLRFGIIGVTETDVANNWVATVQYTVADPTENVRKVVNQIRSKSDVVIVLSHLGVDANKKLAEDVPGIDVIVSGGGRETLAEPALVGNTVIVQAGYDGEWLGTLEVSFDTQGKPSEPQVQIIPLGPEIDSDPTLTAIVTKYQPEATPTPTP